MTMPGLVLRRRDLFKDVLKTPVSAGLNQSEILMIPKQSYKVEIFYYSSFWYKFLCRHLHSHSYSQQICAPMFLCLALTSSERYTEWNAPIRSA